MTVRIHQRPSRPIFFVTSRARWYKGLPTMRPKPICLALAAVLLGALSPLHVQAQTCALLPPGTPAEGAPAPADAQAAALEAVTGALATDGVTVIGSADAQRRMVGEPFVECNALDCGAEVVRSLGVDFVVLVTVWAPRGAPTSVVVTLIGASDSAAGDAPVEGDVVDATLRALATARQRWQAAQMGFIDVRSSPPGADVELDGRLIGRTPIRHLAMAGQRRVRIHLEGYEPIEESVRVEPTQEHPVEVTLSEATAPPPVVPETRTEPHFANWLIGGALIAGGVAALISPLHTLATLGNCADAAGLPGGWCRSEVTFGAQSGVLLGVGAAALIGGVVFLIAQPFQVTTVITPDSARLGISGTF